MFHFALGVIEIDIDTPRNEPENFCHTVVGDGPTSEPKTPSSTPQLTPRKPKPEPATRKKSRVAHKPVPLEKFEEYLRRKKAESYKEGNGFLQDYEVGDGFLAVFE